MGGGRFSRVNSLSYTILHAVVQIGCGSVVESPELTWRSFFQLWGMMDIRPWYCKKLQFSVYLLRTERKDRKQLSCSSTRSKICFIPARCQWGRYTIFLSIVMNLLFQIVWDSTSVLLWGVVDTISCQWWIICLQNSGRWPLRSKRL